MQLKDTLAVHQGVLQVWDVEGPAVSKSIARALGLALDEEGNIAKQLRLIGAMDVSRGDFTFQLGQCVCVCVCVGGSMGWWWWW